MQKINVNYRVESIVKDKLDKYKNESGMKIGDIVNTIFQFNDKSIELFIDMYRFFNSNPKARCKIFFSGKGLIWDTKIANEVISFINSEDGKKKLQDAELLLGFHHTDIRNLKSIVNDVVSFLPNQDEIFQINSVYKIADSQKFDKIFDKNLSENQHLKLLEIENIIQDRHVYKKILFEILDKDSKDVEPKVHIDLFVDIKKYEDLKSLLKKIELS